MTSLTKMILGVFLVGLVLLFLILFVDESVEQSAAALDNTSLQGEAHSTPRVWQLLSSDQVSLEDSLFIQGAFPEHKVQVLSWSQLSLSDETSPSLVLDPPEPTHGKFLREIDPSWQWMILQSSEFAREGGVLVVRDERGLELAECVRRVIRPPRQLWAVFWPRTEGKSWGLGRSRALRFQPLGSADEVWVPASLSNSGGPMRLVSTHHRTEDHDLVDDVISADLGRHFAVKDCSPSGFRRQECLKETLQRKLNLPILPRAGLVLSTHCGTMQDLRVLLRVLERSLIRFRLEYSQDAQAVVAICDEDVPIFVAEVRPNRQSWRFDFEVRFVRSTSQSAGAGLSGLIANLARAADFYFAPSLRHPKAREWLFQAVYSGAVPVFPEDDLLHRLFTHRRSAFIAEGRNALIPDADSSASEDDIYGQMIASSLTLTQALAEFALGDQGSFSAMRLAGLGVWLNALILPQGHTRVDLFKRWSEHMTSNLEMKRLFP